MTATNHALTGAAIATLVRQPLLAIPLAFLSHFVCDSLPHFKLEITFGSKAMWRYLYVEATIMIVLATTLLLLGTRQSVWILIVCALVAMSPDIAWYFYGKSGRQGKPEQFDFLNKFHYKIQWSETKLGIVPELFWAGCMVTIILQ